VLDDPAATVNDAAFSWYPKEGWLGVAMRTDRWRYVEWTKPNEKPLRELYDISRDPQNDLNLAANPERASLLESLSQRLRARFPVQEYQPPPPRRQTR
jgi:iduronate 2-sulfatase